MQQVGYYPELLRDAARSAKYKISIKLSTAFAAEAHRAELIIDDAYDTDTVYFKFKISANKKIILQGFPL